MLFPLPAMPEFKSEQDLEFHLALVEHLILRGLELSPNLLWGDAKQLAQW